MPTGEGERRTVKDSRYQVSGVNKLMCFNCHKKIKEGEKRIPYTSRIVIHERCKHNAEEYAQP